MPRKSPTPEKPDIVAFLLTLHPFVAHQFIISVFAEWSERLYPNSYGGLEAKKAADRSFLLALRRSLRAQLLEPPPRRHSGSGKVPSLKVSALSEGKKADVVALMASVQADAAIEFLADIAASWCLAIPAGQAHLLSVVPRDSSHQAFADAVIEWFTRYSDLWN